MKFWDKLYYDKIYHLNYETLTVQQEHETRELIDYLGLSWEDECLSPHKNNRSVRTASQQQVREQIYAGSSLEWLKFEEFLSIPFASL